MYEHAGPACALSGLIVGIFAILLHDNHPPPTVPKSPTRDFIAAPPRVGGSSNPEPPAAIRRPPPPEIATSRPLAERPRVPKPTVKPRAVRDPESRPQAPIEPPKSPKLNPPPNPKPNPPGPRPSFAIVGPGESLADVAARVYGSRDAAEALWKANRDQVERLDSPLPRGTLLRVP
jgi:hypothetical protein